MNKANFITVLCVSLSMLRAVVSQVQGLILRDPAFDSCHASTQVLCCCRHLRLVALDARAFAVLYLLPTANVVLLGDLYTLSCAQIPADCLGDCSDLGTLPAIPNGQASVMTLPSFGFGDYCSDCSMNPSR